jgi:hypothetical protein
MIAKASDSKHADVLKMITELHPKICNFENPIYKEVLTDTWNNFIDKRLKEKELFLMNR